MIRYLLIIITFFLGATKAFSQSYVAFEKEPQMQLSPLKEYYNYKIKYKAIEKSTIYLELKKGNTIVASGIIDVPKASEKSVTTSIKTKSLGALSEGTNYSYNLYMYAGGRNDWNKKACRSVSIPRVKMKKKASTSQKNSMSFKSLFN